MDSRCYTCFEKSFYSLLSKYNFSEVDELKAKKEFLKYLSELDNGVVAPQIARDIHAKFRELLNDEDPYSEEKNDHNKTILTLFRELEKNVLLSENPFNKALRYAIAGNIIDFGPAQKFDLLKTIEKVEKSAFAIDDSQELERAIAKAKNILYLGDNSGEIVLDKLFIKTINHPNVYFAVRGNPVINDVTIKEARQVGMDEVATVISNGYDAPSTLINKASDEFMDVYNKADLIISKGMGNLEGLLNNTREDIFFLLMVKCDVIGELVSVNKGEFVVMKNRNCDI